VRVSEAAGRWSRSGAPTACAALSGVGLAVRSAALAGRRRPLGWGRRGILAPGVTNPAGWAAVVGVECRVGGWSGGILVGIAGWGG
jgi:hypothetical protein